MVLLRLSKGLKSLLPDWEQLQRGSLKIKTRILKTQLTLVSYSRCERPPQLEPRPPWLSPARRGHRWPRPAAGRGASQHILGAPFFSRCASLGLAFQARGGWESCWSEPGPSRRHDASVLCPALLPAR